MSGQKDREKRREEREAAESKAAGGDRRTRLLQLAAGGVFLAIIVVVVVIIVAGSGGSSGGGDKPDRRTGDRGRQTARRHPAERRRARQSERAGDPDTSTATCSARSARSIPKKSCPEVIEKQVKNGEVKIVYPRLHHHQRRIDPGRRSRPRRGRTGQRLDLHRALLPQPGRGALGLRDRRIHRRDRRRRGRPGHEAVQRRT